MNKLSILILGLVIISLAGGAMAAKLTDEQKIQLEIDILEDLKTSVSTWNDLS